jgi:hypothetical protein
MGRKLTLDVDTLQVTSFEMGEELEQVGTVRAHDQAGGPSARTACFTTPCCPPTVTCSPSPA